MCARACVRIRVHVCAYVCVCVCARARLHVCVLCGSHVYKCASIEAAAAVTVFGRADLVQELEEGLPRGI